MNKEYTYNRYNTLLIKAMNIRQVFILQQV